MSQLLDNLRQKSDRAKKQIAFLTALTFAGLIFVVWLSVFFPSWKSGQDKENAVSNLEPSPLQGLSRIFSGGASSITGAINDVKEKISSIATTTATSTISQ